MGRRPANYAPPEQASAAHSASPPSSPVPAPVATMEPSPPTTPASNTAADRLAAIDAELAALAPDVEADRRRQRAQELLTQKEAIHEEQRQEAQREQLLEQLRGSAQAVNEAQDAAEQAWEAFCPHLLGYAKALQGLTEAYAQVEAARDAHDLLRRTFDEGDKAERGLLSLPETKPTNNRAPYNRKHLTSSDRNTEMLENALTVVARQPGIQGQDFAAALQRLRSDRLL